MATGVKTLAKVNIVFFASLKEKIGQSSYLAELDLPITIGQLKQQLSNELDKGDAVLEIGIQSSVDFEFARDEDLIPVDVKEVAFFPPVTGG